MGGLAYDPEHKILWYSSNINGIAQAVSIKMDTIEAYDYDDSHCRGYLQTVSLMEL